MRTFFTRCECPDSSEYIIVQIRTKTNFFLKIKLSSLYFLYQLVYKTTFSQSSWLHLKTSNFVWPIVYNHSSVCYYRRLKRSVLFTPDQSAFFHLLLSSFVSLWPLQPQIFVFGRLEPGMVFCWCVLICTLSRDQRSTRMFFYRVNANINTDYYCLRRTRTSICKWSAFTVKNENAGVHI